MSSARCFNRGLNIGVREQYPAEVLNMELSVHASGPMFGAEVFYMKKVSIQLYEQCPSVFSKL